MFLIIYIALCAISYLILKDIGEEALAIVVGISAIIVSFIVSVITDLLNVFDFSDIIAFGAIAFLIVYALQKREKDEEAAEKDIDNIVHHIQDVAHLAVGYRKVSHLDFEPAKKVIHMDVFIFDGVYFAGYRMLTKEPLEWYTWTEADYNNACYGSDYEPYSSHTVEQLKTATLEYREDLKFTIHIYCSNKIAFNKAMAEASKFCQCETSKTGLVTLRFDNSAKNN